MSILSIQSMIKLTKNINIVFSLITNPETKLNKAKQKQLLVFGQTKCLSSCNKMAKVSLDAG